MATAKSPHHNSGREKLHQAYNLAGEAASDTAEHLKARAKTSAENLKERAKSSVEAGKQRATSMERKVESSIKEHPLISVGCAFAVGWVIAKLLK
ncbi:DUF883 family protein [Microbulbifer hainanensis]|uniref:DUF883 family protein n=1 Tax=Microbulbifer hainanensis TaxID=2735675 RepID=UPI0018665741|nr:DUF883 family protein [Microbulbifer hainanensis]